MDAILFLIFAAIAVVCAINLVLQTHPISSALSLIGVMGALAVLYLLLGGEFIAAAQLIVYAGAIMVLFVFVIMLLNAGQRNRTSASAVGAATRACRCSSRFSALVAYFVQRMLPPGRSVQLRRLSPRQRARHRQEAVSPLICCRLKSPAS